MVSVIAKIAEQRKTAAPETGAAASLFPHISPLFHCSRGGIGVQFVIPPGTEDNAWI